MASQLMDLRLKNKALKVENRILKQQLDIFRKVVELNGLDLEECEVPTGSPGNDNSQAT